MARLTESEWVEGCTADICAACHKPWTEHLTDRAIKDCDRELDDRALDNYYAEMQRIERKFDAMASIYADEWCDVCHAAIDTPPLCPRCEDETVRVDREAGL